MNYWNTWSNNMDSHKPILFKQIEDGLENFFKNELGEDNCEGFSIEMVQNVNDYSSSYEVIMIARLTLYGVHINDRQSIETSKFATDLSDKKIQDVYDKILKHWIDKISEFDKMRENKTLVLHIDSKDDITRAMCKNYMREVVHG